MKRNRLTPTRLLKAATLLSIPLLFCLGCKSKPNSNKFEETLDKNIELCANIFIEQGLDSTGAIAICACFLEELYQKDSTFAAMNELDLHAFVEENMEEITNTCIEKLKEQKKEE
ncbi:hypothetical protein D0T50_05405 [Bacteroides sp. 214]|uniref:hypothetical protein n=1 Tax=Bacteroides sp. 214 TaxID=2302935 RepID=UPI0013D0166B|nr:hypothetical protein [Bacteroides sp. 214]NDW12325.1 hypothetical protein [Bacteroides sp. 214]